ncbi:hypothetical protein HaLaN_32088, partial [Haematococcus lacustris]
MTITIANVIPNAPSPSLKRDLDKTHSSRGQSQSPMQSALRASRVTLPTSLARATHRTMACKDDAVLELINKQLRLYNA